MPGDDRTRRAEVSAENSEAADETFGQILQLVRVVQKGMQSIDDSHGLSGAQLLALWQISAQPGVRVAELAKALHVKPSTASNLLDKLEVRQLVRRERHGEDTRVVCLHLTQAGRKQMMDIPGPLHGRLRGALASMPAPLLANLRAGLASLLDLVSDRPETP